MLNWYDFFNYLTTPQLGINEMYLFADVQAKLGNDASVERHSCRGYILPYGWRPRGLQYGERTGKDEKNQCAFAISPSLSPVSSAVNF